MPSDEEIWAAQQDEITARRLAEWNDNWGGPAPLCEPPDRQKGQTKHAVLPSIWKIKDGDLPSLGGTEKKTETWRDRPPML